MTMQLTPEQYQQRIENARNTDIMALIGKLGYELYKAGRLFKIDIRGERTPSCVIYPEDNSFFDFGSRRGGSPIDFLMVSQNLTLPEALDSLNGSGLPEYTPPPKKVRVDSPPINVKFYERMREETGSSKTNLDYWASRGLTEETVKRFRLFTVEWANHFYLNDEKHKARFTRYMIPTWLGKTLYSVQARRATDQQIQQAITDGYVNDLGEEVAAYFGRFEADAQAIDWLFGPKYMRNGSAKIFNAEAFMSVDAEGKRSLKNLDVLFITEGPVCAMSIEQAGYPAIANLSHTNPHLDKYFRNVGKIIIIADNDEPGHQIASDLAASFKGIYGEKVMVTSVPHEKDVNDFLVTHGLSALEDFLSSAAS